MVAAPSGAFSPDQQAALNADAERYATNLPSAARQLLQAVRAARFKGPVHRSGEPIAVVGTLIVLGEG
jgi:hypothetical protein